MYITIIKSLSRYSNIKPIAFKADLLKIFRAYLYKKQVQMVVFS